MRIKHGMGLLDRFRRKKPKDEIVAGITSRPISRNINFATAAGIPDITQDTNSFRDDSNFDNVYFHAKFLIKVINTLTSSVILY